MKLYSINGKILANLKLDHLHHDKITSLLIVKCNHKKDDFLYITGLQSGQIIFWKLIPQLNKNKNQVLKVPFLFIKYWQSDIIAIGSINHLFCSFDYKRLYYSSQNHISYLYQNKDIKMLSNHLVETDFGSLLGGAVDLDQKNEHVSGGMHSHNMGNINHLNEIINIDNNNNNKIKSIHNLTSNQDMCYVCKRKFNNQRRKRICKICNNYICSNCFVVNTLIDSNGGNGIFICKNCNGKKLKFSSSQKNQNKKKSTKKKKKIF
ncbi:1-phosphatidylinositol 3-phosphate 5-kinase-related [Anaeramoeba flamelloides]|uniref:1-phosphatidylinositol 3-phosphate 5-kinase-related n=1 Tax=Anaeramoeba flamelloides TaxID=1746091 RepID=A0AAV7YMX5_9EUKA|nr:1-phosphatidylinositol 3-phosphate 5-kinase-related [Anaeramoeba flamelloides]